MNIHYALQTCDIASNQQWQRIYGSSKTELAKKCVTSFFNSIEYVVNKNKDVIHNVMIFDDHSTEELLSFLHSVQQKYSSDNIKIGIHNLETQGIMNSIGACYDWLNDNGTDLVYQVQDDYLFKPECIYELVDMYFQLVEKCRADAILTPYNAPYLWNNGSYSFNVTPRMIVQGVSGYWIQNYDISCSFLCSINQFRKHTDLMNVFLNLDPNHDKLESISLNKIFTTRGVLGMAPINSIALHMQTERERDPYVDWKPIWDGIEC